MTFVPDATITSEVVSGTKGALDAYLAGGAGGSLVYQSAADTTAFLAIGTNGYVLTSNGTAPTWTAASSITSGSATTATSAGTAYATIGTHTAGTGLSGTAFTGSANQTWTLNTATLMQTTVNLASGAAWQIPYQSAANTTAFASSGTTGQFWQATTNGAPTWTTTASMYVANAAISTNLRGGSAGGLHYQTAADTSAFLAIGTNGYVLTSNGSAPVWSAASSITSGSASQVANALTIGTGLAGSPSSTYNGSAAVTITLTTSTLMQTTVNLGSGAAGSLPYQSGANATTFLGIGAAGTVLQSTGSAPVWNTTASVYVGYAKQVETIATVGTTFYYPAFVSANNAAATASSVYTTSSFYLSPTTGIVTATSINITNSLGVGTIPSGTAGEIRATNEITAYYSDRRLKENVVIIGDAVEKVKKLNGITYTPNDLAASFGYDKTVKLVGLFADEVDAVQPEAVRAAPFDSDEKGNSISGENYKTIQYEKLVPLLIEAIKEQQKTIEILSAEIKSIKEQLVK